MIPLSCPSCKCKFKLDDKLAGCEIECPVCKRPLPVPAKVDGEAARPAEQASQPGPQEAGQTTAQPADEADKPGPDETIDMSLAPVHRRKKRIRTEKEKEKKKTKINKDLIVGFGFGGLTVVLIALLAFVFVGGGKIRFGDRSGQPGPSSSGQAKSGSRAQTVGRSVDVDEAKRSLKQIGSALLTWYDEGNRGPANQFELSMYYAFDERINDLLLDKRLTIIWGLPKDRFVAKFSQLVGYETEPDSNGIRVVLRTLGGVEEMNEEEFQEAAKATAQ